MIHPEIICPYCRIQLGFYKLDKSKLSVSENIKNIFIKNKLDKTNILHLDLFWSYESGLVKNCIQPNIKDYIESIDSNNNINFKSDFQIIKNDLLNKFNECPDDISKDNFNFDDYLIAFINCVNNGDIESENEEFDRSNFNTEKVKELYESGENLFNTLKFFIKKYE